jgi:hypothetical protein
MLVGIAVGQVAGIALTLLVGATILTGHRDRARRRCARVVGMLTILLSGGAG